MPDRFAAGLFQAGSQYRFHMDGIGTFPLFGTLMSYANGARFAAQFTSALSTNPDESSKTQSITHNIPDYSYAIFFIPEYFQPSTHAYCVMGVLSPSTPSLNSSPLPGFREGSDTGITLPTTFTPKVTFTMSTTQFTVKLNAGSSTIYNLWLFVY